MRSALLQHSSRNQLWLQCVQMLGWGSIELQQLAAECSCRGWEQRDGGGGKMQDVSVAKLELQLGQQQWHCMQHHCITTKGCFTRPPDTMHSCTHHSMDGWL